MEEEEAALEEDEMLDENSLPEREPLHFEINPDDYPADMSHVIMEIKKLGESLLYHWKSFPIILPSSITLRDQPDTRHNVSFKDLFIAPTFDELEQVAMNGAKNGAKKLNETQLENVRLHGEFEVESINFPGQTHRWRLTQLLQKGTVRARDSLLNDAACSLRLLIITARNRFISHFFSLSQALKAIAKTGWQLLDMLIGMPSTSICDLDEKLYLEHMRYLVAELDIKTSCQTEWMTFCDYVKEKQKEIETEKSRTTDLHPPSVPYRFQTPKGIDVDLRLFNRDIMAKCTPMLKSILERESKGWYIKYKDRIISHLKGQNLSYKEITEHVNKSIKEEYLRRVFDAILRSEELEDIQPRIGQLLVEQAKSVIVMQRALDNIKEKMAKHCTQLEAHLVKSYPVRSRIQAWVNEKFEEFRQEFVSMNQWAPHEESLTACRDDNLHQAVYFLHRDLIFMRDREPVLTKELGRVKHPTRVFTFLQQIWLPKNRLVEKHQYGETSTIPTVIEESPYSLPTSWSHQPDEPTFTVTKKTSLKSNTRYPFWRWLNYFLRTWTWAWNAMFWMGVVIPWCSPVSLRALFFPTAFIPDLELNPVNGVLCPKPSSKTHTLISRLHALWDHVRYSRTQFESEPDTGFLGKSFTRQVNRAWNYGLKGALGSTALVLCFTPLCLLASFFSVLAAVTAPLWMPVASLCFHIGCVLFYDVDHPKEGNAIMYLFEALLFRLLLQGILQPIAALITALVVLPFASAIIILWAVCKRGFRGLWDAFMFHAVIKKRARVPASDTFVARRIAGPGLASNYFYQIHPEQVLAAVESRMELHELSAWSDAVTATIDLPKREYKRFVDTVMRPFSGGIMEMGMYHELLRELKGLHDTLHKLVEQRKNKLNTGLTNDIQSRIKLTSRELKVIVAQTAKLLQDFYPERVIKRLDRTEEEFWETKHLDSNDWQGLATQLLTEVFSTGFLTPLEETDTCFKLELHHLNLSRYLEMLKSSEFRDDLDVVSTVHTPKGDIDVDAPYFEVHRFSPVRQDVHYAEFFTASRSPKYNSKGLRSTQRRGHRRWPWKRKYTLNLDPQLQKLDVPLPVAHPVVVSVLINNRDNDGDPINLENTAVQRIIRAAEDIAAFHDSGTDPHQHGHHQHRRRYSSDAGIIDDSTDHTTTTNSGSETTAGRVRRRDGGGGGDRGGHGGVMMSATAHLAEQEMAFSDDQRDVTDTSPTRSSAHVIPPIAEVRLEVPTELSLERTPERAQFPAESPDSVTGESRVVYTEREGDNSCVDMEEESSEEDKETGEGRYHTASREGDAGKSASV